VPDASGDVTDVPAVRSAAEEPVHRRPSGGERVGDAILAFPCICAVRR
jgi:hypothetical protein